MTTLIEPVGFWLIKYQTIALTDRVYDLGYPNLKLKSGAFDIVLYRVYRRIICWGAFTAEMRKRTH
jgi:hypothetical protein